VEEGGNGGWITFARWGRIGRRGGYKAVARESRRGSSPAVGRALGRTVIFGEKVVERKRGARLV
jgi:hypothetical protein